MPVLDRCLSDCRYNIPASVRANDQINKPDEKTGDHPMGPDIKASPSILRKIATARASLEKSGFTVLDHEWGDVTSEKLGRVSALYHMQWGWDMAPGKHWGSGVMSSLTGQMAMWINEYLEPTDVTVRDITDDIRPLVRESESDFPLSRLNFPLFFLHCCPILLYLSFAFHGQGQHNPAGGMSSSANNGGSESEFRMTAIVQAACTDLWNAYFDEHDIDFILTPSLWSDSTVRTMHTIYYAIEGNRSK